MGKGQEQGVAKRKKGRPRQLNQVKTKSSLVIDIIKSTGREETFLIILHLLLPLLFFRSLPLLLMMPSHQMHIILYNNTMTHRREKNQHDLQYRRRTGSTATSKTMAELDDKQENET